MKKSRCRWCSDELKDGRRYEYFCDGDCVQEWEDLNCEGDDDDDTDMWLQQYYSETPQYIPYKNGGGIYSLVGVGIWGDVCEKALTPHRKSDKGAK